MLLISVSKKARSWLLWSNLKNQWSRKSFRACHQKPKALPISFLRPILIKSEFSKTLHGGNFELFQIQEKIANKNSLLVCNICHEQNLSSGVYLSPNLHLAKMYHIILSIISDHFTNCSKLLPVITLSDV